MLPEPFKPWIVLTAHPDTTVEEIAAELGLSASGVRYHIGRLNRLYGTTTRAGAQIEALRTFDILLSDIKKFGAKSNE